MSDSVNFTFEMDECLRAAVRSTQSREVTSSKRNKTWETIAKLVPGDVSAKACMNRWMQIQSLPGLEYTSLFQPEPGKLLETKTSKSTLALPSQRLRASSQADETSGSDIEPRPVEESSDDTEDELVKAQSGNIVIHVSDDQRKINRDFTCDKHELLRGMGYFRDYIKAETPTADIDISVHCDVTVFEWLVNWLHCKHQSKPEMNPLMVVSVLISAHFLRMPPLVQECIEYIARHLSEVIALPIDLSCINEELVSRLAEEVTLNEIERAQDRKDKMLPRLYKHKVHQLLLDETVLCKCAFCGRMFTPDQREWMVCSKAKIFIDFHGNVLAQHVQERSFDRNAFVETLHLKRKMSWKDVFWRVWAMVQTLRCITCGQQFVLTDLGHCAYHPHSALFAEGENTGSHPCCGMQVARFSTASQKERGGCAAQEHRVVDSSDFEMVQLVKRHAQAALTAFDRKSALQELPAHVDPDTLLTARVPAPVTLRADRDDSVGSDDDSAVSGSATDTSGVDSDGSGRTDDSDDSDDSDSDSASRHRRVPRYLSARSTARARRPPSGSGTHRRKLSPRSERQWRENSLREDDLARMHSTINSLVAQREPVKGDKADKYAGGLAAKVEQRLKSAILGNKTIRHSASAKFSRT
eukprot:TRINITY_DN11514_c0_g1_i1.p1 TRINITY_DN11514_c0_g1~~TRINITY_DN11514_c0_g1_i1.p1  ORF type:complete len:640 (-),score=128.82 TRINITY_DN11514_c0_g1_i1:1537-3456(-)